MPILRQMYFNFLNSWFVGTAVFKSVDFRLIFIDDNYFRGSFFNHLNIIMYACPSVF